MPCSRCTTASPCCRSTNASNGTSTDRVVWTRRGSTTTIAWCSSVSRVFGLKLRMVATRCPWNSSRSEEHTSELQSQFHLVCRLLLENKILGCTDATTKLPLATCSFTAHIDRDV